MSQGIVCDHCLRAETDDNRLPGWLVLGAMGPCDHSANPLHALLAQAAGSAGLAEPEPPALPFKGLRHFCSTDCLVGYVRSDFRSLLEQDRSR